MSSQSNQLGQRSNAGEPQVRRLADFGEFVGRDEELGVLSDALAVARGGQGHLILVAGEPGIGKTRLAEEFGRQAATYGAPVIWAHCQQVAWAPPYWPWTQITGAPYVAA